MWHLRFLCSRAKHNSKQCAGRSRAISKDAGAAEYQEACSSLLEPVSKMQGHSKCWLEPASEPQEHPMAARASIGAARVLEMVAWACPELQWNSKSLLGECCLLFVFCLYQPFLALHLFFAHGYVQVLTTYIYAHIHSPLLSNMYMQIFVSNIFYSLIFSRSRHNAIIFKPMAWKMTRGVIVIPHRRRRVSSRTIIRTVFACLVDAGEHPIVKP